MIYLMCFFLKQIEKVEKFVAADESRPNIEHLSEYLSFIDLTRTVKSKLPEDTSIPSEATVLLAFVPKMHMHANLSKLYKVRVALRIKIQTRQHRAAHVYDITVWRIFVT